MKARARHTFRAFGPGLVSGASANDPTTVGSLAVVGAATGYGLAWLVVLLLPILAVVQAIAASVATISQMSLQEAITRRYGRAMALASAAAIVAIGLLTLGADVAAGAQALALLFKVPPSFFVMPFVIVAGWLLATKSYVRIERTLAWLTVIFLCYVAGAIAARPDWLAVAHAIIVPHLAFTPAMVTGALALLGTTITSYVYVWESIEVAERRPHASQLRAVNADAVLGMTVAASSFLFILVTTAATAGAHHAAIASAADAAAALRPLAGRFDQTLFAIGLLASAAIAVPVIAATNGYVIAQTIGARAGLALLVPEAKSFYGAIFASLGIGAVFALLPVPTLSMLYWVSVAAGLAAPITLVLMMLVARDRATMGGRPIAGPLAAAGWTITALVTAASASVVVLTVRPFFATG